MQFLNIETSARLVGTGETLSAVLARPDISLVRACAGAWGGVRRLEIAASHIEWLGGVGLDHVVGGTRIGALRVGGMASYLAPKMDITDASGQLTGQQLTFRNFALGGGLGYDLGTVKLGVMPKFYTSSFSLSGGASPAAASGLNLDAGLVLAETEGVIFVSGENLLSANVSYGDGGAPIPLLRRIRFGFGGMTSLGEGGDLGFGTDISIAPEGRNSWHLGGEWLILKTLAARVGYIYRPSPDPSSITAGAGLTIGPVTGDYAYAVYGLGSVDSIHRFGLRVAFGRSVEELATARKSEEEVARGAEEHRKKARVESLVVQAEAEVQRARGKKDEGIVFTADYYAKQSRRALDGGESDKATDLALKSLAQLGVKPKAVSAAAPVQAVVAPGEVVFKPPKKLLLVALANVSTAHMPAEMGIALADTIRTEFFRTKCFMALTGDQMRQKFAAQNISEQECGDVSCAAQVGKLLGVQVVFYASVAKIEDTYRVTLTGVDTGTAETKSVCQLKFRTVDEMETEAKTAVEEIARQFGYVHSR